MFKLDKVFFTSCSKLLCGVVLQSPCILMVDVLQQKLKYGAYSCKR